MLRITLSQRPDGKDIASCGPHRVIARTGAAMALARELIAAGFPDAPWEAVGQDGQVRMTGSSLHEWACWTMREDDGGLRRVPYVPNARFRPPQATPDGPEAPPATRHPPTPESPPSDVPARMFAQRDEPSHD